MSSPSISMSLKVNEKTAPSNQWGKAVKITRTSAPFTVPRIRQVGAPLKTQEGPMYKLQLMD